MTVTSPLRGPKSTKGGGFAAAHFRRAAQGYGAAPPASRVLRIALRATALRAALDPGDHCGPWEQEQRAGPGLPRRTRGAQTPVPAASGRAGEPRSRSRRCPWFRILRAARAGDLSHP